MPRPRTSRSRGLTIFFHETITRATSFEKKSFSENLCSLKIVSYKHIGTCRQDNNPFSEKLSGQKKLDTNILARYWHTSNKKKKFVKIFWSILSIKFRFSTKASKIWQNLLVDLNLIKHTSNSVGDFVKKNCGLLRKLELYLFGSVTGKEPKNKDQAS